MASARSTVSIARTTPAQKPRGEHSITFNGGFAEGLDVMSGSIRDQVRLKLRKGKSDDGGADVPPVRTSRLCPAKGKIYIDGVNSPARRMAKAAGGLQLSEASGPPRLTT